MDKRQSRLRRSKRTRAKVRELGTVRLSVHRTPRHIYAQVFKSDGSIVIAAASTLDKDVKKTLVGHKGNVDSAKAVGEAIAKRLIALGIKKVAFDRSGFKYHGRVKALADAAREAGLEF